MSTSTIETEVASRSFAFAQRVLIDTTKVRGILNDLNNRESAQRAKVVFDHLQLPDQTWPPTDVETLWAEKVDKDTYRLLNIPFYVCNIAFHDIIRAVPRIDDDRPHFEKVIVRSGHSTYRVICKSPQGDKLCADLVDFFSKLETIGCNYERANETLFAIDIPTGIDVSIIYELLEDGEKRNIFYFGEGFFYQSKL